MQAGTTPKKRTSLNGRAALKLMRLDGARRADQAASDARVTKASSSIAVALLLISSGASATECQSSPGHDGKWWSYRIVDSKRCWYQGRPGRSKDLLQWAKQSPPPVVTRPDPGDSPPPAPPVPPPAHRDRRHNTEGGLDRVDPGADEQGAADGRAPAVFARAAAIASQADEAVEVVDAALDHSSHRDRAGGRRITVSTSAMDLVQELQKTVDELAGTPGRASRSNGGQHHAVVTPRVETSPDRSDFAKLGETIALEQTKQFADDIRSQVAGRELASVKHAQITGDLLRGLISAHAIGEAPFAVVRHHDAPVLKHVQRGAQRG